MRVTNNMMINNFNRNLSKNLRAMNKTNEQLVSGLSINRPSDDPTGITYSLRLRTNLTENDQFQKNVSDARSWMETTDATLDQAGQALQRARELTVQAANGTNDSGSLEAINLELEEIRKQLEGVANTDLGGRYIFSGTQTDTEPYTAGVWNGNDKPSRYEIGAGTVLPVNVTGESCFVRKSSDDVTKVLDTNVFEALESLRAKVTAGDTVGISSQLSQLDIWISKNITTRAEVGARLNRLELTENRLSSNDLNLNGLLDKTENVDQAKAITELKMQESTYNTSLAVGARIIQPTLMDFLR